MTMLARRGLARINNVCSRMLTSANTFNGDVTDHQIAQLNDQVPLVDVDDKVIGPSSKKACHVRRGNEDGLLHRAFSVFLFNSKKELLLQQRSSAKITFPNYYTNTCCSHPRFNDDELDETEHKGIRCAAQRRMNYELGIPVEEIPLDSFDVITRVHYSANSDDNWCEHELDYILICQRDVSLNNINEDEVQNIMYKSKEGFRTFMETTVKDEGLLITPWFNFVVQNFLYTWWDYLEDLSPMKNGKIYRAGRQT